MTHLTPDVIRALQDKCDRVPDTDHARERLAEARAALARVRPPSNPDQDKDGLYYPLLFLIESVAPVLDWLNAPSKTCDCKKGESCSDCDPEGHAYPPAPPDPEGKTPMERWLS